MLATMDPVLSLGETGLPGENQPCLVELNWTPLFSQVKAYKCLEKILLGFAKVCLFKAGIITALRKIRGCSVNELYM